MQPRAALWRACCERGAGDDGVPFLTDTGADMMRIGKRRIFLTCRKNGEYYDKD
jgi:hypothetical protein